MPGPDDDLTVKLHAQQLVDRSCTSKQHFEYLYGDLHARAKLIIRRKHRLDPTGATSLVHEAFIRLRQSEYLDINDDAHFIALGSLTMRRIVIDRAKSIRAEKNGSGKQHESLEDYHLKLDRDPDELIAIDQALDQIAIDKPRASQVGELIIFASLGIKETAALLGVSRKTVQRDVDELACMLQALGYGKNASAAAT